MTLHLIGTGMTQNSLPADALAILKTSDKIYLENYTVNFPYPKEELEKNYNIKIQELSRQQVENESILKEAKTKNIALLVCGDSLSATTHMQLILEAKKQNIPYKVYHNASILTTIAETGLSLYKFGKTTSMPNWTEHTNKPTSFINYIKQNLSIDAHSLILTDIGLEIKNAIEQLMESSEKENLKLPEKIIAISHAGMPKQKIFYDIPQDLQNKNIPMPFCLIIPSNLHFLEEEALKNLKNNNV
jgi:diphthine synthase